MYCIWRMEITQNWGNWKLLRYYCKLHCFESASIHLCREMNGMYLYTILSILQHTGLHNYLSLNPVFLRLAQRKSHECVGYYELFQRRVTSQFAKYSCLVIPTAAWRDGPEERDRITVSGSRVPRHWFGCRPPFYADCNSSGKAGHASNGARLKQKLSRHRKPDRN